MCTSLYGLHGDVPLDSVSFCSFLSQTDITIILGESVLNKAYWFLANLFHQKCVVYSFITAVCFLFLVKLRWLKRQEYLRFMIISGLCWERRCHTGRFATTIFNATHLATLLRHYFEWLQHSCNIATLCCAKNRRCESSLVTSPLDKLPARYKRALAFLREIGYPLLTHWISILLNKVAFHFRTKNREIGSVIRSCEAVRKDKKIVRLTAESWALACLRPYFITSFGP